ncbi:MAG TPA: TolC family protein, partial [Gemmatimonadaceae bacterium]|nr:TolC family protein [Gemmatimonadaceae bacterium]
MTARPHRIATIGLVAALAAAVATLTLGAPGTLGAQAAPRTLTLSDALAQAERANPEYLQASNDVDVAEAQRRQALAAYLPSLRASMGFDGGGTQTLTGEDDFGNPIRGSRQTIRSSSASQRLSLDLNVFDGGARERRISAAREQLRAAGMGTDARRAQLHAQVTAQYYRAQAAAATVALEERLLASAREQLDATERRFRIAVARREDVLGSEADVASAEVRVERARGEARKAVLELARIVGIGGGAELALVDDIPRPALDDTLDADALARAALQAHPTIRAEEARAAAADRSADAARGGRWPAVNASASYSRSDRSSGFGSFFDVNPVGTRGFSFGLSTTLPVFDRFQNAAQVAQADAQAGDARQAVRAARLRVEAEVRAAVIDVENARRALRLAEQAAAVSRERVELTQERYQAGGVDFVQLQSVLR